MSDLARTQALLALATAELPAEELVGLAVRTVEQHTGRPASWAPSGPGVEVVVDGEQHGVLMPDDPFTAQVADVLGSALARDRLVRRVQHLTAAQRISHVGSYDFDVTRNTNDWSDQLYRIYGREPGSFMATYERFLELVHPDDREGIVAVHQQALAELAPYQMEERIVWPDGQVRTLASWGEVVPDSTGRPARMVGICWDITEQKETTAALQRSSARFQQLIESAPDVVLVVDAAGTVLQANARAITVLGRDPAELVGRPVTAVLPDGAVSGESTARHANGRDVPVDISTSTIDAEDGPVTAAFVRDVTDRKRAESLALQLHDDEVRRRHALEINDNVVQGLASVLYLLDLSRADAAHAAAQHTLDAARTMMSDLLRGAGDVLAPGDLIRDHAHAGTLAEAVPEPPPAAQGSVRVLLVDDADDIRLLLRLNLRTEPGFDIVGEAADGAEAVRLAHELQPDAILLDLSMPVMDGLQALPLLREASPQVQVVVLSGFDETRMRESALAAGAQAYLEKGQSISTVVEQLRALFPDRLADVPAPPTDPDADSALEFDGDMVVHELRTPLTVVTGLLTTLRDRMDVLPSATTKELLAAGLRNAEQMRGLLDVVADARRASHGLLPVEPEPTDVARLVRDCVADLCGAHAWPAAPVSGPASLTADVDPDRVRQVLANLLSNAYRFGADVQVGVRERDGRVEVEVSDSGPGVPEQRRAELFTKFARLGAGGPGMGLGLYISRAIAREHGGDLVLQDGPRTCFVLQVPVRRQVTVPR